MRLSERGCDIKEKGETLGKIKLMKTREGDRELLTYLVLNRMLHAHMRKKNGGNRNEKEEETTRHTYQKRELLHLLHLIRDKHRQLIFGNLGCSCDICFNALLRKNLLPLT